MSVRATTRKPRTVWTACGAGWHPAADWWLIGFRRDLIKDLEKPVANFRANQVEVRTHFVVELRRAIPMTLFSLRPSHRDRPIWWETTEKSLPEDLIALRR
jgi:hypothetical protein